MTRIHTCSFWFWCLFLCSACWKEIHCAHGASSCRGIHPPPLHNGHSRPAITCPLPLLLASWLSARFFCLCLPACKVIAAVPIGLFLTHCFLLTQAGTGERNKHVYARCAWHYIYARCACMFLAVALSVMPWQSQGSRRIWRCTVPHAHAASSMPRGCNFCNFETPQVHATGWQHRMGFKHEAP